MKLDQFVNKSHDGKMHGDGAAEYLIKSDTFVDYELFVKHLNGLIETKAMVK